MKAIRFMAAFLLVLAGCNKSITTISSSYSGNFILTSPLDVPLSGKMHIKFSDVNFTGAGDSSILPYIGTGVFKLSGDSIFFTQTGPVPEIFGRGSILEGGFFLEQNTDSLVFSRKSVDGLIGPEVRYQLHRD